MFIKASTILAVQTDIAQFKKACLADNVKLTEKQLEEMINYIMLTQLSNSTGTMTESVNLVDNSLLEFLVSYYNNLNFSLKYCKYSANLFFNTFNALFVGAVINIESINFKSNNCVMTFVIKVVFPVPA